MRRLSLCAALFSISCSQGAPVDDSGLPAHCRSSSQFTQISDSGRFEFTLWNCVQPDASIFYEGYRYPIEVRRDGGLVRLLACETFGTPDCGKRCGTSCAPCMPLQTLPIQYGYGVAVTMIAEEIVPAPDGGCELTRPLEPGPYKARFCYSRTAVDAGLGLLECGEEDFKYPPGGYVSHRALP